MSTSYQPNFCFQFSPNQIQRRQKRWLKSQTSNDIEIDKQIWTNETYNTTKRHDMN
jgi:hypothetical protein